MIGVVIPPLESGLSRRCSTDSSPRFEVARAGLSSAGRNVAEANEWFDVPHPDYRRSRGTLCSSRQAQLARGLSV